MNNQPGLTIPPAGHSSIKNVSRNLWPQLGIRLRTVSSPGALKVNQLSRVEQQQSWKQSPPLSIYLSPRLGGWNADNNPPALLYIYLKWRFPFKTI
jgi:hypothetical protein